MSNPDETFAACPWHKMRSLSLPQLVSYNIKDTVISPHIPRLVTLSLENSESSALDGMVGYHGYRQYGVTFPEEDEAVQEEEEDSVKEVTSSDKSLKSLGNAEVYDIDTEIPNIPSNEDSIDTEPELYCFEDFLPTEHVDPQPRPSTPFVSGRTRSSTPYRPLSIGPKLYRSDSLFTPSSPGKAPPGRELQRSKTLPLMRTPVTSPDDQLDTASSSAAHLQFLQHQSNDKNSWLRTASPDSSEYSGSCGSESGKPLMRGTTQKTRQKSLTRDRRRIFHKHPNQSGGSAWNFDDDTDSTTSSETMTSASEDGTCHHRTSGQLFYTTPPKANMVRSPDEKRLESGGVYKITRRLSQKDRGQDNWHQHRQRSVSLDCGDGRKIKIFMTDGETTGVEDVPIISPSPSAPSHLLNLSGAMTSPNRPQKMLTVAPPKKRVSMGSESDSLSSNKLYDRRKADKERRLSPETTALFEAVEQQDIDLTKTVLEADCVDINSINSEGLTPLDVAVMTNNIPMAKMLLSHGARESLLFQKNDSRSARLDALVSDAERRVVDLSAVILNTSAGNGSMSNTQQKENERRLSHWEFRHKLLKRMKAGYDHARAPDPPSCVSLTVASSSSLQVRFDEPLNHNGAVVTKYKVEWSCFEDFIPLAGEITVDDMRHLEYEIPGLVKGNKYFVRVSAWNMKGYSPSTPAQPTYAVPSSWRDFEGFSTSRTEGKLELLQQIFSQVKQLRPADASELKENVGDSPQQRKRKSIKNLFTSAPKFHKALKRGVYLACLLYSGDKVFVTSDDQLPVVEVDENFAGHAVYNDLHWLMKISCNWDDVKSFRQDMDKSTSAGTMHFRNKLLQATSVLQTALGVNDLGQFHHKPLKDVNGSIILTAINDVKDSKSVLLGSGKWVSFAKLFRRSSAPHYGSAGTESSDSMDILLNSISEMILYHQISAVPLSKGLYLGYLKVQVSVELIQLLIPRKAPNTLPNIRLRSCPNISREEWAWLQSLSAADQPVAPPTPSQLSFQKDLLTGAHKLFNILDIPENFADNHRIYDLEVIEVSDDVTFLLLLPPIENVCIVPGQSDDLAAKKDFMLLPVKVFETIHLNTYRSQMLGHYSRLSSLLEIDLSLAQQAQREAFSSDELSAAKLRVDRLNHLQQTIDTGWKSMRWVMDVITYARDKSVRGGTSIGVIKSVNLDARTLDIEKPLNGKIFDNNNSQPSCGSTSCDSNEISVGKDNRKIAKFYDPNEEVRQTNGHVQQGRQTTTPENKTTRTRSAGSRSAAMHTTGTHSSETTANSSGILEVYAAYDTGLSKGTRVRLHVTSRTTAREVVNLVVKQLNKALVMKGKSGPTYSDAQLIDFCLVAVIGARERILRDDYQPLQLQNPWTKGRLFVRSKNNLLAAIQQGHATEV